MSEHHEPEQIILNKANAFIYQVICLRQTANDMHESLNEVGRNRELRLQLRSTETEERKRMVGNALSTAILRALAMEVALKALSLKRTGEYRRGHDLLALFKDLDSSTREITSSLEGKYEVASLRDILDRHKDVFLDWRYAMEESRELNVGLLDMENALGILIDTYDHPDFNRLCVNR